jgi:hypothetical protein
MNVGVLPFSGRLACFSFRLLASGGNAASGHRYFLGIAPVSSGITPRPTHA